MCVDLVSSRGWLQYANDPHRRVAAARHAELEADYAFEQELGGDEVATVYLARERELGRDVVIRVGTAGAASTLRLRHEAQVLGSLHHPHIPALHAVRRVGTDGLALVTQYVRGPTLREVVQRGGTPPLETVARVVQEIGGALAYAHAQGIVHGSVAPDQIRLEDESGRAVLAGFGAGPDASASAGGDPYRAPELERGLVPDARTDQYGLAATACALLTAAAPWDNGPWAERRTAPGPQLASLRSDVPQSMRAALQRALRPEPGQRWPDVPTFLRAMAGQAVAAGRGAGTGAVAAAGQAVAGQAVAGQAEAPHPPWMLPPDVHAAVSNPRRRPPRRGAGAWRVAVAVVALVLGGAAWLVVTDRAPAWLAGLAGSAGLDAMVGFGGGGTPPPQPPELLPLDTGRFGENVAPMEIAPANPALAYALFGDAQNGVVGDTLAEQLVLRVEDVSGNAVPGVTVRFAVLAGEGTLLPDSVATDAFGMAAARWVPSVDGQHEIEARVEGLSRGATFRAVVRARGEAATASRPAARPSADAAAPARATPAPVRPAGLPVRTGLVLGGTHSCVLRQTGEAVCWGGNESGQLGAGGTGRRGAAGRVGAPEPLADLAAGVSHTCAIGVSGSLYCWGSNGSGQLGAGGGGSYATPVRVETGQRMIGVAAGLAHSCGIAADGTLYCWGQNTHGQLGDGSRTDRSRPVRASRSGFRALAVGWTHSCALDGTGAAFCWGRNAGGELGNGSTEDAAEPVAVSGGHRFTALAAGSHHTCGLRGDGAILCWGQNANGQLGNGSVEAALVPTPVAGAARFVAVSVGGVHGCGLTRDGAAHCWGRNAYGQLGDGTGTDRASPVPVAGGFRFAAVQASGAHTCGRTVDGRDVCWGYNAEGQLGVATPGNRNRPTPVVAGW